MKITSTTTGRDQLVWKMQTYAGTRSILVAVATKATDGGYVYRVRNKTQVKTPARADWENARIVRASAKQGRSVIFLFQQEWDKCQRYWREAINRFLKTLNPNELDSGASWVGHEIVTSIEDHINKSVGESGRLKELKETTVRQKKREVGEENARKPLVRTGQLLKAFKYVIRKL